MEEPEMEEPETEGLVDPCPLPSTASPIAPLLCLRVLHTSLLMQNLEAG
jgi:hypothetical protein